MERLTKSELVNGFPVCCPESNTGLPHLVTKGNPYRKIIEKLKEYEDLEEQGKLLRLPCAVGDTVYVLEKSQTGRYMIYQTTADNFYCAIWMLDGKFGKCIFHTFEEAEAALKELREKEQNEI